MRRCPAGLYTGVMRSFRWLAPGALLSLAACGSIDRSALDSPGPMDAGQGTPGDLGATPADAGPPVNTDSGTRPPPPVDAGPPPPVDAGPPPPVDAGPPPRDVGGDPGCRACVAFAPVTFCPGTGAGACLSYAGCSAEGCARCASALGGGENCSDPIVIGTSGRRRTVVSTCGARNDVDTGCSERSGPDIVIGLRVVRRGRVEARLTVPPGVSVNFGYDLPPGGCRNRGALRPCAGNQTSATQGFDLPLDAGTYYLYVSTSVASTIVVETNLP